MLISLEPEMDGKDVVGEGVGSRHVVVGWGWCGSAQRWVISKAAFTNPSFVLLLDFIMDAIENLHFFF